MKGSSHKFVGKGAEEYFAHFFIEVLLLLLECPDDVVEMLIESVHVAKEQQRVLQERIARMKERTEC